MTRDPMYVNVPLSETLVGIRLRAGMSVRALAEFLEVDAGRVALFETKALPDPELMEHYGKLARGR